MADVKYGDLTLEAAIKLADDPDTKALLQRMAERIGEVRPAQERFRTACDRFDKLYYAEDFTEWGADLWPFDPSALQPGRSHVSVNTPSVYVDIPAAMQSVKPIENIVATDNTEEARAAASALERLKAAWTAQDGFDLKFAKACVVKGLYGRTAGRVYWDKNQTPAYPCVEIVEQPRNLLLGYKTDSYNQLEWAAYVTRMDPNAVLEEFGVEIAVRDYEGTSTPFVVLVGQDAVPARSWLSFGAARIEVWDYWYREPVWRKGKLVRMETKNVVIAGNAIVRGPTAYPEYDGQIPYVPLFNTFLPGVPDGRAALYDVEQLIREKYEKITAGSQMIAAGVAGDYWQLVGLEAPSRVPDGLKPIRNKIIGPGAGNRIETITPFIAEFQLEQFLARLDREMAVVSGLNDLLLGLAPLQSLSSSKAVNALIANYELRISMPRLLLYVWRRELWELVVKVWSKKDATVAKIVQGGGGTLDIISPSLNPRDEMETMTRAANAVGAKLWSQRRGMDAVGVDDPETEQDMIREERTDATMFPVDVLQMAQLMQTLQALGLRQPPGAQDQAQGQLASGQADLSKALGASTAVNSTSSQLPGDQGVMPPEGVPAGGTPAANAPFAQGPQAPMQTQLQGMTSQGPGGQLKSSSRILTQTQLGRR